MTRVNLNVNGIPVNAEVEPRVHLGDFLRSQAGLTGTHLGCEHGVCGACTVLLDGKPVRSCITFAVACEGRNVTTIEGHDDDLVMGRLRAAFSGHHALQCGYCTPGMLATARDIVLRLPDADEATVRLELSGNLCRCTGYAGIVGAILAVLADLRQTPDKAIDALRPRTAQGGGASAARIPVVRPTSVSASPLFAPATDVPAPAEQAVPAVNHDAEPTPSGKAPAPVPVPVPVPVPAVSAEPITAIAAFMAATGGLPAASVRDAPAARATPTPAPAPKGTQIEAMFEVLADVQAVWKFMVDLPAVASCLPGTSIEELEDDQVKGRISIKFGPMNAAFAGSARLERDDQARAAVLRGAGLDSLSQSRATGDVHYRLESASPGATTVHVALIYTLQGPLAQFSRSGLVQDFVRHMVVDFGTNVNARLRHASENTPPPAQPPISPVSFLFSGLWRKFMRLFGRG